MITRISLKDHAIANAKGCTAGTAVEQREPEEERLEILHIYFLTYIKLALCIYVCVYTYLFIFASRAVRVECANAPRPPTSLYITKTAVITRPKHVRLYTHSASIYTHVCAGFVVVVVSPSHTQALDNCARSRAHVRREICARDMRSSHFFGIIF